MAIKNDNRILELTKKIQEKKQKLGKLQRFTPITNCTLELDGVRHNLNVLDKDKLIFLLMKLNSYRLSAEDLNVTLEVGGYPLADWMEDIQSKLDIIAHKEEEKQLKEMEIKLEKLLSKDKKVELELDNIESLLS